MSYYYKYNFKSPEPLYARVKEELRSYFDTGAIDDALFTVYTDDCLKKLGKGTLKIEQTLLHIQDSHSRLPEDFDSVREAWMCVDKDVHLRLPSANYQQVSQHEHQITTTSLRLDTPGIFCDICDACEFPDIVQAIYKTTKEVLFSTRRSHLLTPGNISAIEHCGPHCPNIGSHSPDTFDIRDNKFVTNFRHGVVHLLYYINEFTPEGYQLIPDNVRIGEYIMSYLKYRMFEQLYNQVTDETYNQIKEKYETYKAEQFEKQVLAEIEMKKQTAHQKHQATQRTLSRNSKYRIR